MDNPNKEFVISDGVLIGNFEGLYRSVEDPWGQSDYQQQLDSRRVLAVEWCKKLSGDGVQGSIKVLELGCGLGHLTRRLHDLGFEALGTDISSTAIEKARVLHPGVSFSQAAFEDFSKVSDFDTDIIIMAEITWYVLKELDDFISFLRGYAKSRTRPTYLIHVLTTYPPGVQSYGKEFFTNLDEILDYFPFDVIESASFSTVKLSDASSRGTFFVARV